MHLEKRTAEDKSLRPSFGGKKIVALLALIYIGVAAVAAWSVIAHTEASTKAIEQILTTYNMKNEGEQAVDRYAHEHPVLSFFLGSPVKSELKLPSHEEATQALSTDVARLLKTVKQESSIAAWWSWFLLCLSSAYVIVLIALERNFTTRPVLFALTCVSVACFFVGILAPAMVIWTAPTIPLASGDLSFVLQHQVRGIAAIIWELITTGHWIIGGFLFLFSILTPLTKAALMFFVTGSKSRDLNLKIVQVLHTIGKWSMADVFVAGILLSLYALKAQEATKSIPCLGLYYFIGYCLLSMTTSELLTRSGAVAGNDEAKADTKLGRGVIGGLFAGLAAFMVLSCLYTFQQYTYNLKEHVAVTDTPQKLNNADLVLPAHK